MQSVPADIRNNLAALQDRIKVAAKCAGRKPAEIQLIAVSKTLPVARVKAAYEQGLRVFGENRVQELVSKAAAMPPDCEWHLIGHLQKNKVRDAVKAASWIHSLDSIPLAERISRIAVAEQKCPKVLLQVNIAEEEGKFGATVSDTGKILRRLLELPHLQCRGFMTMAPFDVDEAVLRHVFGGLRRLRDQMALDFQVDLPELSMGMSGDFEVAIQEGATMVRVGTAIFGYRD